MAAFMFSSSVMYTDIHQDKPHASTIAYADDMIEISDDLREEKEATHIRVRIEDKDLNASPIVRNGRTMLPFRSVFENLGGKVSFDKRSNKITADVAGKTIVMKVGTTEATLTENGNTRSVTLAAAPFVSKGQTYIPVRDVAVMTGLQVEYSKWDSRVDIYDKEKMIADINKDFTIYNSLLKKNSMKSLQATHQAHIEFNIDADLKAFDQKVKIGSKVTFDGLTKGMDLNGTLKLKTELGDLEKVFSTPGEDEEFKQIKGLLSSDYKLILNSKAKKAFFKSDQLSKYTDNPVNTWLSVSDSSIADLSEVNSNYIENLLQNPEKLSMGEILFKTVEEQAQMNDDYLEANVYTRVKDASEGLKMMFGDEGFVKTDHGYELKLDKAGLAKRMAKYLSTNFDKNSLDDIKSFDYKMVLKNVGSDNIDIDMKLSMILTETSGDVSVNMDISANDQDAKVLMDIAFADQGKVKIDIKSTIKETNEKLVLAPPAGEAIKELY